MTDASSVVIVTREKCSVCVEKRQKSHPIIFANIGKKKSGFYPKKEGSMTELKPVLDVTCGSRMIWFNPQNPLALFLDKRNLENKKIYDGKDGKRYLTVKPDVVADFTHLPFSDESFYLVVFDPPHLIQGGDTSWIVQKYGRLPKDWKAELRAGFRECMRVLKQNGTLIFKWNETQIPTSKIIEAIGEMPLFGNRCGKSSKTNWMVFFKWNRRVNNELSI